jgi:hypothetical protein
MRRPSTVSPPTRRKRVRKRVALSLLTVGLVALLLPGAVAAGGSGAPNQGDPSKVLTVDNPYEYCDAVPGYKVEGDFGQYIKIWSKDPIDFVTVKSGRDASVLWSDTGEDYGKYWIKFKLSKDISNYVVWTCPCENEPG